MHIVTTDRLKLSSNLCLRVCVGSKFQPYWTRRFSRKRPKQTWSRRLMSWDFLPSPCCVGEDGGPRAHHVCVVQYKEIKQQHSLLHLFAVWLWCLLLWLQKTAGLGLKKSYGNVIVFKADKPFKIKQCVFKACYSTFGSIISANFQEILLVWQPFTLMTCCY